MSFIGNIQRIVFITSFHNKKINLLFKHLNIHENSIKGYVEIAIVDYWVSTSFELRKNREDRKIEINNPYPGELYAKKKHFFSFSGYKFTYKETDCSNYSLLTEVTDIHISNQDVFPNPVSLKKLESMLLIRFTDKEFRILKESSLNFDGFPLSWNFTIAARKRT